ncbi:phytoene/squalene synthase family protein [Alishewanella tabrizica]|uniref:Phytoene synthase n=1 Tax=Alishewanella tabrizica TaxID=671278 RepID=A0ABQ2WE49_9ALTE|nr:phytoene/squalene synthase family protein [Alishewanella tabrizica]GGW51893.1 phytoene synthase [Alishewanella tabrizica]
MHHDAATEVLKKHGKSFHFARLFLETDTGNAAARLYRFCRLIDDIADETPDKNQARSQLEIIKQDIIANSATHPIVQDFLLLCREYSIDPHHGITLITGVLQDLDPVALSSYNDLLNYAFRVAGVVGLMMAPILGSNRHGHVFAIDLGIAMQFTNIARDVLEDAQMSRRYLPASWVEDMTVTQLLSPTEQQQAIVKQAIARLLNTAEIFYTSGISGLYYLHPRNRKAIAVAAYLYREIGRKLMHRHCDYLKGRVSISYTRKCTLAVKALVDMRFTKMARELPQHEQTLHRLLIIPSAEDYHHHV